LLKTLGALYWSSVFAGLFGRPLNDEEDVIVVGCDENLLNFMRSRDEKCKLKENLVFPAFDPEVD